MAMSRENMAAEDDAIGECSNLRVNAKESCKGPISIEQAAALSCYPFMNLSLFSFHSLNTHGFGPVMTFQDMVLEASNGVVHHGSVNQLENCSVVDIAGVTEKGDDYHYVHSVDPSCNHAATTLNSEQLDSTNMDWQQVSSSANCTNHAAETTAGGVIGSDDCTETIPIEDVISEDEGVDSIILDCGAGVKPWPKWKRFPKDAPDAVPPRLMGAIEMQQGKQLA